MMRRMARVLGTCAAAATLALTVPGTSYAAHGFLVIDGAAHQDPSGCFPLGDFVPPVVTNRTDAIVEVWSEPGCQGRVEWLVRPGETYRPNGNRSVFVL